MVKRQREKQYNSAREHRDYAQLRSGAAASSGWSQVQRRLPWGHCALTLLPFADPVCTRQHGIVFDNAAIVPFVLRHKIDPVTGAPATVRDLITLRMDRDEEGRWQCPVLTKHLNDRSKVVAVVQPGTNEAYVYSYQAYSELNVKANRYEDLITSAPFDPKRDVIVLHDPDNDEWNQKRDISNFYHIRHGKQLGIGQFAEGATGDVRHSKTAQRVLEQLQKNRESQSSAPRQDAPSGPDDDDDSSSARATTKKPKILASDVLGVQYTTGKASTSFTSTAVEVNYDNESREATPEEVLQSQFQLMRKRKKRGYVRLNTAFGVLVLELRCDVAPRTCTNFLGLCKQGRYNGTVFHRLIPNFMIQGGKAASNQEDSSLWGGDFADEFDDRLTHSGAGVLSMANSGPNTNRQQFFLTFKSCHHLDRKHSVFGTVVEGLDVLRQLENVETDKKNCPVREIKILSADVVVDPAQEAQELEQRRFEDIVAARDQASRALPAKPKPSPAAAAAAAKASDAVGRYLQQRPHEDSLTKASGADASARAAKKDPADESSDFPAPSRLPPPPKSTTFGNFSGW